MLRDLLALTDEPRRWTGSEILMRILIANDGRCAGTRPDGLACALSGLCRVMWCGFPMEDRSGRVSSLSSGQAIRPFEPGQWLYWSQLGHTNRRVASCVLMRCYETQHRYWWWQAIKSCRQPAVMMCFIPARLPQHWKGSFFAKRPANGIFRWSDGRR